MKKLVLAAAVVLLSTSAALAQGARTSERIVDVPHSRLNENNPPNGSIRHVINGLAGTTPCAPGGTGALAIKLNGVWNCPRVSSGAGTGDMMGTASSAAGELVLFGDTSGKTAGRSNSLNGIPLLTAGVVSVLTSTGSGGVVRATTPTVTNPVLVTPTIAAFTNAQHSHDSGPGGGQLNASTVFNAGTIPPARVISGSLIGNRCLRVNNVLQIEEAAEDCGGGSGTPGGVSGNLAFNESGSFGGIANSTYDSITGRLSLNQKANGNDTLYSQRFTDTTPTGTFLKFRTADGATDLFLVSVDGSVFFSNRIISKNIAAPAVPAAGNTVVWSDLTDKNLKAQDDAGNVSITLRPVACSGTDKVSAISSSGVVTCTADQGGTGDGVITLNGLSASTQTFTTSNDANVTLTINSATSVHDFVVGWNGALTKIRQHSATVYNDASNIYSTGAQNFAAATSLTLPTAAGAAPTANGTIAFDPTSNTLEYGENGSNRTVVNTAGSQTLSNKTLDNSTTANLRDSLLTIQDNADSTKTINFDVSAVASGTNRIINVPNANTVTVQPTTATTNQFVTHIDSAGIVQKAQPSFSNLSGTMGETQGGTGQTSYAQGDILYASAANTLSKLNKSTSATRYLANTGPSNNPEWALVDLSNGVTGALPFASLSGSATDAQVPDNITISLAAVATSANAGDSATAFFSSGVLETTIGGTGLSSPGASGNVLQSNGTVWTSSAVDFSELTGTATDAQIPNTITIDLATLATTATTANAGDSATAFFSAGTIEAARLPDLSGLNGAVTDAQVPNTITIDLAAVATVANSGDSATAFFSAGVIEPARLGTGTPSSTNFLRGDGTWVTPSGAGDMVLAGVQTVTGAKTFDPAKLIVGSTASAPTPSLGAFYVNSTDGKVFFGIDGTNWGELFVAGLSTLSLASANVIGTLPLARGGTNQTTWTASRCVQVNSAGTALESAAAACGAGGGGSGTVSSATVTQVAYYTGATTVSGDAGMLYDATNDALAVGGNGTFGAVLTNGSGAGYLELAEGTAPTVVANRLTFAAPTDVAASGLLYILPSDTPANGEQLTANISGTTVTLSWDAAGSGGSGDSISVNGSGTTDANFINTAASGTVPSITWSLNTATAPDEVSISAIGAASATEAGVITTGVQTIAGAKTFGTSVRLPNAGLLLEDTNASHTLQVSPGSDLTANRIFTITTGDAARTLSMAGNITVAADLITSGANSLTLTTTGSTNVTLPTSGTLTRTADNLGVFAATTSAQLATVLSDEEGSAGGFVRATSPTLTTPAISGAITFPDNVRQTFNPGANAAGLNVGSLAGDPDTPTNGDIWYDSTANELTARINGANVALGAGGGGGSGTVSTATITQVAFYTGTTTVSGDTGMIYDTSTDSLSVGGVLTANTLTTNGAGAGYLELAEGTAPSLVANRVQHVASTDAPAAGSAYLWGATASSGVLRVTNSSGSMTVTHDAGLSHLAASTSAELRALLSDENGTGASLFVGGNIGAGTATTAAANDSSTLIATTAYVQTELTAYAADVKTLSNTTYDTEGTGNAFTSTHPLDFDAAGCSGTTASSFWDLPTATPAVAACVTGTNTQKAVLDFADTTGGFSAQTKFRLPGDFTGAIDARITWFTSATSGNVEWSLSFICTATDGTETDDPAFNTASTVVTAAPGVANRLQTSSITSATITGCGPNELMHARIFRDGNDAQDTLGATARLVGVQLILRRAQ